MTTCEWLSGLVIYTVRYIDDLLTVNNSNFSEEITHIYSPDLTRELVSQISTYPTWIFQLVYGVVNMLLWSNDKRDAFNFNIVNFPSNIPANPTYGIYISQLITISRIC